MNRSPSRAQNPSTLSGLTMPVSVRVAFCLAHCSAAGATHSPIAAASAASSSPASRTLRLTPRTDSPAARITTSSLRAASPPSVIRLPIRVATGNDS